jgi:hypothetical protein
VDILATMLIYTIATAAFFLLGAGVLHEQGLVPKANDMISVLSRMYTETLGAWSLPIFYIGAIATLYGTIFAATAAESRVFADLCRLLGRFESDDYAARVRHRNFFVWVLTVIPALMFLVVKSPVAMVKAGGVAQALMLPALAGSALYLRHKKMPKAVMPAWWATAGLWIASTAIFAMMGYYAWMTLVG